MVKATKKTCFEECKAPGDFYFTEAGEGPYRRLSFLCPCGCGVLAGVRVRPDGQNDGQAWGWNQNEEVPTATPSINILNGPNSSHWHGYLTDGEFSQC